MKLKYAGIVVLGITLAALAVQKGDKQMTNNKLTPEEEYVIVHKGTEAPFSGEYLNNKKQGTYVCKRCGATLYRSSDKFDGHCGWPSFDDEIPGAVKRIPDPDGHRTEIICANCGAHLGHVFTGEGLTEKNIRHCVNSISLVFVPAAKADANDPNDPNSKPSTKAYFAGGCFWGVDYWLKSAPGVISVTAGYMGGTTKNPTYKQVCTGTTGHAETVEVVFDPNKTTYEDLAKLFFEIHDPTQRNRQGPDIGYQYRSAIFYANQQQKQIAERLIEQLKKKGLKVVTSVEPAKEFWPAEDYHQDYYNKTGGAPYCHFRTKRF
ncbi:MAG: bifunctional methionine sulfoxide reductase B/A protein [Sedimentisphaerales bacterium]